MTVARALAAGGSPLHDKDTHTPASSWESARHTAAATTQCVHWMCSPGPAACSCHCSPTGCWQCVACMCCVFERSLCVACVCCVVRQRQLRVLPLTLCVCLRESGMLSLWECCMLSINLVHLCVCVWWYAACGLLPSCDQLPLLQLHCGYMLCVWVLLLCDVCICVWRHCRAQLSVYVVGVSSQQPAASSSL